MLQSTCMVNHLTASFTAYWRTKKKKFNSGTKLVFNIDCHRRLCKCKSPWEYWDNKAWIQPHNHVHDVCAHETDLLSTIKVILIFLAQLCKLHNGLICFNFCLSACLSFVPQFLLVSGCTPNYFMKINPPPPPPSSNV